MAIPKIRELYNPILDYLYQYGETTLFDIRYAMARSFYIPDKEAFGSDGDKPTLFMGRVNNACFNLYCAGLIIRVKRGVYNIASNGKRAIDNEEFVDSDYLWSFPSYQERMMKRYTATGNSELDDPSSFSEPNPEIKVTPLDKPKPEYRLVEEPSIDDMIKLRDQDVRFANMIASGDFLIDDGIIKQVPQEVLRHDMSYQEYKATTLMHSYSQAIVCYMETNTGKMISAPQPTRSGYHKTSKGSRPWSNPYPAAPGGTSGSGGNKNGNIGTGGYNGNRNYDMVQDMLDFIQKSHGDFNKCFDYLIKDIYGITGTMLSQKTGIDSKKIQRMRNDTNVHVNVEELTAIMLVLQASSYILEAFISLIGLDPKSDKYKPYCLICDLMKYSTYEEVNKQCNKYNRGDIFPQNLSGPIS